MRVTSFILALLLSVTAHSQGVIPRTAYTVRTLTGQDNAALSFDGNTNTSWFPGWSTDPGRCVVVFDGLYQIDKVKVFDGSGRPKLAVYASEHAATPLATIDLQWYTWLDGVYPDATLNVEAPQLVLELQGIQGDRCVPEIELHGRRVGSTPPTDPDTTIVTPPGDTTITPPPPVAGSIGSRMGLCGFHWVPWQNLAGVFRYKRDYQMSHWTWTEAGFSPQPLAGAQSPGVLGYDDYLEEAKRQGVTIIPAVNQTPPWFFGQQAMPEFGYILDNGDEYPVYDPKQGLHLFEQGVQIQYDAASYEPDMPPRKPGSDPTAPASYLDYAKFMFQYAARYGAQVWPHSALQVNTIPAWPNAPVNEKKSGLGLLRFLEPWNEFDKWWKPAGIYMEPEQHAAFLSACYDGHGGTLGPHVGIKRADPDMLVLLPGLTGPDVKYYKRMVDWCRANRPGGTLAWDICNFHHYSNTTNQAGRWPPTWTAGAPADMDPAWGDVQAFVAYAKSLGQPVWWTELGYDSRPPSWQYAPPYGNMSSDALQATWLVRNYLMGFREGIDVVMMFNAINEPGAPNGGLYQNSGLLYGLGDPQPFTPKPAHAALAWMVREIGALSFAGDVSPGQGVKLFKFNGTGVTKLVAWMATADGTTRQIQVDGRTITVTETPQVLQVKSGRGGRIKTNPSLIDRILRPKTVVKVQ